MGEIPYPDFFDKNGKVICQLCGKAFLVISPRHLLKHNITYSEYKLRFPNCPLSTDKFVSATKYGREKGVFTTYENLLKEKGICVAEECKEPEIDDSFEIGEVIALTKKVEKDFSTKNKDKILDHLKMFLTNVRKDYLVQVKIPDGRVFYETISDFCDPVLKLVIDFPETFWHNIDKCLDPNRQSKLNSDGWRIITIKGRAPTFGDIEKILSNV
jgi:very-short-patch-repair endonuclease